MILAVAYSLVNTMKQLVLPKEFSKSRMSTLRTLFIKIAGKSISHVKKIKMRLCSSKPYKEAILKMLENIHLLALAKQFEMIAFSKFKEALGLFTKH